MLPDNCQKIKLLILWEILCQETDEDHPLKTVELCERLVSRGISCDPRTLARNVKLMNEFGYDIRFRLKHHDKAYYVCNRTFSVPELKIMMDAIQAASFVPKEKTKELIERIADLGGSHKGRLLKSNVIAFNTRKHSNDTIYTTVELLETAIKANRKVAFKYFDLNEKAERVYRGEEHVYVMEPIALVYFEDNYYLVTYNEKYENTTNYRVDRMDCVEVLDESISDLAKAKRRSVAHYTASSFKMYQGEEEKVTLQFDDKLMGAVYDKFGEKTKMKRVAEHTIEAKVSVQIAPTFWGWVFQFGNSMKISAPLEVREQYLEHIRNILDEM